jgi:hypothetical protein
MKKGAPKTGNDKEAMRFAQVMRSRGLESLAQMTRKTNPQPENIRTTSTTMTKVNKAEK